MVSRAHDGMKLRRTF